MTFAAEPSGCPLCETVIQRLDGEDLQSERGPAGTLHVVMCRVFEYEGSDEFGQGFSAFFWDSFGEADDRDAVILAEYGQAHTLISRLHSAHQQALGNFAGEALPTAEELFIEELARAPHPWKPPYGTDLGSDLQGDNVRELMACRGGWTPYRVLCAPDYTSEACLAVGERQSASPVAVYGYMRPHDSEDLLPEVHTTGTVDFSIEQITESLSSAEALETVRRLVGEMQHLLGHEADDRPESINR
ncbi:hypothetical protein [Streptomyces sp. NPDC051014]|uniref:hypothetical protein n=1 Tax=Streptomyces sp. NPDC051014 TaxID=3155751 RepID=UPI0033C60FB6